MNYWVVGLLSMSAFVSCFSSIPSPKMVQKYYESIEKLKKESNDKTECECYDALFAKGFSLSEMGAFLNLSSSEQEKMINIVVMTARNKCTEKEIVDGLTVEDKKVLKKFEDFLWDRKGTTPVEEIRHVAISQMLEENNV